MATVPALTDRTPAQRWSEVRDEDGALGRPAPGAARGGEDDPRGDDGGRAGSPGRGRAATSAPACRLDHRNGVYRRMLVTELGAITDLRIPRRRLEPYRPSFLGAGGPPDGDRRRRPAPGLPARPVGPRDGGARARPSPASPSRRRRSAASPAPSTPRSPPSTAGRSRSPPATCSSTASGSASGTATGGRAGSGSILAAYGIDALRPPGAARLPPGDRRVGRRVEPPPDARSSRAGSTPTPSSSRPPTGPRGIAAAVAEAFPGAGPPALLDPPPAQHPRGPPGCRAASPACAACGRSTGPGRGGPPWPPTGAGRATWRARHPVLVRRPRARPRRPAGRVRPAGADPDQPAHDQPDRACLPRAPPPAAAGRLASPTAGQPTGSSMAQVLRLNELLARRPLATFHTGVLTSSGSQATNPTSVLASSGEPRERIRLSPRSAR